MRRQQQQTTEEAVAEILAQPMQRPIMGECAGCGRRIPHGYLVLVTEWRNVEQGRMVQKPEVIYCRQCPASQKILESSGASSYVPKIKSDTASVAASDIATKIMAVCIKSVKPRTSRRIASKCGLEHTAKIRQVLDRLVALGKMKQVESEGHHKWIAVVS